MADIYGLTEQTAEQLARDHRKLKQQMQNVTRGATQKTSRHYHAVWMPPSASNYVEYGLSHKEGDTAATPNWSAGTGTGPKSLWYYATLKTDSEAEVGITHDASESSPSTNGNWTFTKDGLYQVTWASHMSYQTDSNCASFAELKTFYGVANAHGILTDSGGSTPHTHGLSGIPNPETYAQMLLDMPLMYVDFYKKPISGGTIDDFGDTYNKQLDQWRWSFPRLCVGYDADTGNSYYYLLFTTHYRVTAGDKMSIKLTWTKFYAEYPSLVDRRLTVSYIGSGDYTWQQYSAGEWADIP